MTTRGLEAAGHDSAAARRPPRKAIVPALAGAWAAAPSTRVRARFP